MPKVPRPNNFQVGRHGGAQSSGVAHRGHASQSLRSAFAMMSSDSESSDDVPQGRGAQLSGRNRAVPASSTSTHKATEEPESKIKANFQRYQRDKA